MGDVKRYEPSEVKAGAGWPMDAKKDGAWVKYTDHLAALSSAPQGWRPIETAPDKDYHLLADSTKPHLSGVFLGQVVDGKPWDVCRGAYVTADLWMPLLIPAAPATKPTIHRDSAPDGCKWVTETKEDK